MKIRELSVPDAYEITPILRGDDRGVFMEWYRHDIMEETVGHQLDLRQANTSVSKKGVVRGIHYADMPRGQAKYVTATYGAVLDYVIDIRVGSPTFGKWDTVLLDTKDHRAIYLSEGLGHAFVALSDDATVSYLVSDTYNAPREHGVNPLDPEIDLNFPLPVDELILSPKDTDAPSLSRAAAQGLLPTWDAARRFYDSLNAKER